MDHKTATAALKTSTVRPPTPKVLTRKELLIACAQVFSGRKDESFKTLERVEHMDIGALRATKTAETAFEPIEQVFAANHHAMDGTVGRIMDVVPMSKDEVHIFACSCNHGEEMLGSRAAANLMMLTKQRF